MLKILTKQFVFALILMTYVCSPEQFIRAKNQEQFCRTKQTVIPTITDTCWLVALRSNCSPEPTGVVAPASVTLNPLTFNP